MDVPRAYGVAGWVFRLFARWMSKPGSDPLPDLGGRPTVMVANHSSMSDVFYAIAQSLGARSLNLAQPFGNQIDLDVAGYEASERIGLFFGGCG